ncbi:hypothetical protein CEUSTIGMA_g4015.t1 [Chlamydomonas eustigma]|uniref:Carboxypeptidase n=1 Tax=Chlamydomonas eustigma TaxID=1157962 RepID=A0A250X0W2_9CHLO|nr:hypothetical protein CEUSTIGMA_g4015.t1 [Chlamydomonas eustigma]|eukprot:GAX76569.1 hypothetical protein CEUSTIGMA_g4015.t1 [Chlamydomonas eustigma]
MNNFFLAVSIFLTCAFARELELNLNPNVDRSSLHASFENPESVHELPGYNGELKSKHFSGYITIEDHKNLFYYFVQSENSPEDDPVVLWLNGGPGCSSLDGFIYELGPFKFDFPKEDSKHGGGCPAELGDNPYAWSKVANMIFLDSPVGVGLSFSTKKSDYVTGDNQTALDADMFLRAFFEKFPEFQENNFYISGESYAGIYVPNLALTVAENNEAGKLPYINIVGYLVGNGVTDSQVDGDAYPSFAAGKSLISQQLYRNLHHACGGVYWNRTQHSECSKFYEQLEGELSALNIYDVLQYCYHGSDPETAAKTEHTLNKVYQDHRGQWPLPGSTSKPGSVLNFAHLGLNPPCVDARLSDAWLNHPDVRHALHAAPVEEGGRWELCSSRISYTRELETMIPIHRKLTKGYGLDALIYSGDHDLAVPHTGSERWTSELNYPVREVWGPWYVEDHQVAGYSIEYEGLTYATIKGAGHMVPQTNPREAFAMFQRFISGQSLRTGAKTQKRNTNTA